MGEKLDEKIADVKSDIADTRVEFKETLKDVKDSLSAQLGAIGTNVSKAMESVQDTSNRLKQIEEAREKARAVRKWIIGLGAGLVGTGLTYLFQQLLSHVVHK